MYAIRGVFHSTSQDIPFLEIRSSLAPPDHVEMAMMAVHPHHGVMWTDGRGIYLAPLHVEGKQMKNATSVRLGEFDTVTSVHWSNPTDQGDGDGGAPSCHMAVVHQNNVSVWRVSGALPKLSFKQVRKINVRPIAQGCLWNPVTDTLCLLSRHQCSFYFRHDNNKGSYAMPPLESGKISCGCWSSDGKKLIVCIGSTLLIYRWPEGMAGESDGAVQSWTIPSLSGEITSVTPMPKNTIVVATEMPLESLCRKPENQDAFIIPDGNKTNTTNGDDIIRPSNSPSVTQSLMNLQTNSQGRESSSSLVLVRLHDGSKEPTKAFTCPVSGLLTPDILLYEKSSQCVVVGSNSQSQLHIYALLDKRLAYCGDIQLDKSQRPKGLCSVPTYFDERGAALLILVGQRAVEDSSFLSSSTEAEFQLSLKYIIIKAGYEGKTKGTSSRDSLKSRSTTNVNSSGAIGKSESMRERTQSGEGRLRVRSGSGLSELSLMTPQASSSEDIDVDDSAKSQSQVNHGASSASRESPSIKATSQNSSPSSHRSSPTPPISRQHNSSNPSPLTLPNQTPPIIQDLSDQNGTPQTKEDLEVERMSFSSQPPNFSNEKLSSNYELKNSRRGLMNNSAKEMDRITPRLESPIVASQKHQNNEQRRSADSGISSPNLKQHQRKQQEWLGAQKSELSKTETSKVEISDGESPRLRDGSSRSVDMAKSSKEYRKSRQDPSTGKDDAKKLSNGQSRDEMTSDVGSSLHSADSSFDSMEKQVRHQKDTIEALFRRLDELSTTVQESAMVFPTRYQDMKAPELITITCTRNKTTLSKQFLLDNGRLQLEPIKLAFGLATVELLLDGMPIVLGSNIDGYVPIKFSPASSLQISGIPASAT